MALDYTLIGQRLKNARLEKGLTQENLAEELDVSIVYISRVECGTSHINLLRLSEICDLLGIDQGSILNGSSVDSKTYLIDDFNTLLKNCPPDKLKLIYDIAQVIIKEDKAD